MDSKTYRRKREALGFTVNRRSGIPTELKWLLKIYQKEDVTERKPQMLRVLLDLLAAHPDVQLLNNVNKSAMIVWFARGTTQDELFALARDYSSYIDLFANVLTETL